MLNVYLVDETVDKNFDGHIEQVWEARIEEKWAQGDDAGEAVMNLLKIIYPNLNYSNIKEMDTYGK